jgi:4-hydroxy-2-oxoheptanedioate aldolase
MAIALIEDYEAVRNIRSLLRVDGIDVFYVAPSDLAASMGHTGDPGHPDVQAAIAGAIKAISGAGRVAGTLVNDSNVDRFLDMGVRCAGVPWMNWVASGAAPFLNKVNGRKKGPAPASSSRGRPAGRKPR